SCPQQTDDHAVAAPRLPGPTSDISNGGCRTSYSHDVNEEIEDGHLGDVQRNEHNPDEKASRKKLFLRGIAIGATLIILIQLTGILFVK
ncbi:hypothetical protein ACFYPF_28160, partial [Micromonospora sp. NPDC005223]